MNVSYRIDSTDAITDVNEGWDAFALANDGDLLLQPGILGTSLWRWIVDPTTREVYRSLLRRIREDAQPVRFRFRCDSPGRRRLLEMEMTLATNGDVDFQTTSVSEQARTEIAFINPATARSGALITICGWCLRIPVSAKWLEIEEGVLALGLFEAETMPQLSHAMCPACYETMLEAC